MKHILVYLIILLLAMPHAVARVIDSNDQTRQNTKRTFEATVPDEWKPYLAVDKLTVVGSPFYGVTRIHRSVTPMVWINWSVSATTFNFIPEIQ